MRRKRSSIVAISCVRNEADIVEAFVRHTLAHCDRMLIVDHGSTDDTGEILRSLVDEGLPIEVTVDPTPGYRQAEQITVLARAAAEAPGTAWIVPLDADEFILTEEGGTLGEALLSHSGPVFVSWVTYCPSEGDDETELNPAVRLRHRREHEPTVWTKVMFPADVALRAFVEAGNHNVVVDGMAGPRPFLDGVRLAHLPIRDSAQWVRKTAINVYRWRSIGDDYVGDKLYRLLESDPEGFAAGFRTEALRYALFDGDEVAGLVRDPLPYRGGPLRYTRPPRSGEPWRSVLEYAGALATELGVARGAVRSDRGDSVPEAPPPAPDQPVGAGGAPVDDDEIPAAAAAATQARDWPRARQLWERLFELDGTGVGEEAYASLARVYRKLGDTDSAERVVTEGRVRFPDSISLVLEQAEVATASREWDAAVDHWRTGREALGDRFPAVAYSGFVKALRAAGHADDAFRVAEEGLEAFPGDSGILRERARVLRSWPWLGGSRPSAGTPDKDTRRMVAASPERQLLERFDLAPETVTANRALMEAFHRDRTIDPKRALWIVPFVSHIEWGGFYTILRLADQLSGASGTHNQLALLGQARVAVGDLEAAIREAFPKLLFDLVPLDEGDDVRDFKPADIGFATVWTSAVHLARFDRCRGKFYIMQDFEPSFSPAGAVSGLIEQTYRLGFDGIANSRGVADSYAAYGNMVHCLDPPVDTAVFRPGQPGDDGPIRIVFYGRPSKPRNGFELGAAALTRVKEQFGDRVEIVSVGEEFDETDHGLDGVLTNLGVLPGLEAVAELYRSCDIGLVFMFTKHPSYQPLEYMASGCATVTNVNEANEWLLRDRINARLAVPTVSGVVEAITELIEVPDIRSRIVEGGLSTVRGSDWEKELALAHRFITTGVGRDG